VRDSVTTTRLWLVLAALLMLMWFAAVVLA
jgi:hypothetical protein